MSYLLIKFKVQLLYGEMWLYWLSRFILRSYDLFLVAADIFDIILEIDILRMILGNIS
jgi:hypothetical protein